MKKHTVSWKSDLREGVHSLAQLPLKQRDSAQLKKVLERFPLRIPKHLLEHYDFSDRNCPVVKQLLPSTQELKLGGAKDPLQEEPFQIQPGIIQRFSDRVLLLVSNACPLHCRHCNRKRNWTKETKVARPEQVARAIGPNIREVILSGGDPLILLDHHLKELLSASRASPGVQTLRIHTRIPFSLPSRITRGLIALLKQHQPLWLLTQFNHEKELYPKAQAALLQLRKSGIPLLNQAVLLRGINDSLQAQTRLGRRLVQLGVKPHYLFMLDRAEGTLHFQVQLQKAMDLISKLRATCSGLIVPQLIVDLPGPHGKVPLGASTIENLSKAGAWILGKNQTRIFYPQAPHESTCSTEEPCF